MAEGHVEFQYENIDHQSDTALSGMWLFLAQEVMFFGGLFYAWTLTRHYHPIGFHRAAQETVLVIGSINCALLITSSFVFYLGLRFIEEGRVEWMTRCLVLVIAIGTTFLILKGIEWHEDLNDHMNPGIHFGLTGPDAGGAQLFWVFYWIATVLHGIHMSVAVGLVVWLVRKARQGAYSKDWYTPVEVVGIFWSFVDMVWLVLYPLIYLAGRPG